MILMYSKTRNRTITFLQIQILNLRIRLFPKNCRPRVRESLHIPVALCMIFLRNFCLCIYLKVK